MGVYINMEMPTSCYKCYLKQRNGMDIVCPVLGERFSIADVNILYYRLDNCPLVPVPPHGRLVDADRLLSEQMKQKYYHLPNGDTAIPIIDVEHAPTAIEKEEVYSQYTDTAGNFHWCGTHSGEHTIKAEEKET